MLHTLIHKLWLALACALTVAACEGQQIFQKEYYGGSVTKGVLANNSGYYFASSGYQDIFKLHQIFLYHIDLAGNIVWAKSIGNNNPLNEHFYDFCFNIDSTAIVIIGESEELNNTQQSNINIYKVDLAGNLVWAKFVGGSLINAARVIYRDGPNYYIGGTAYYNQVVDTGGVGMLLEFDENGNKLSELYLSSVGVSLMSLSGILKHNSSLYLTGNVKLVSNQKRKMFFIKLDNGIDVDFMKTYESINDIHAHAIQKDYNDGGLINGSIFSGNTMCFALSIDTIGNIQSLKSFDKPCSGNSFTKTSDSGFGLTFGDASVIITDSLYNITWASAFTPGFLFRSLSHVTETSDGGLIATGSVNNTFTSLIIKIDSLYNGGCNTNSTIVNITNINFTIADDSAIVLNNVINYSTSPTPITNINSPATVYCSTSTNVSEFDLTKTSVLLYPNPFTDLLEIKINLPDAKLVSAGITDLFGNIRPVTLSQDEENERYNLKPTNIDDGIFVLELKFDTGLIIRKKIIKQ